MKDWTGKSFVWKDNIKVLENLIPIFFTFLVSISDAITGQIQTAEQLDGRGAALMHIMMQHVFGGKNLFGAKKIQPKEITQEKYRKNNYFICNLFFFKAFLLQFHIGIL